MIDSAIRTKFQISKSLAAVTDNSSCRYALGCVQVTPAETEERVHLAATDGRIGVVVESEGYSDQQRLVPQAILPTRKGACEVSLNGKWLSDQGKYADNEDFGRFPHLADCFPVVEADNTISLRLNVELLAKLANAVGPDESNSVLLHIPLEDGEVTKAIAVSGREGVGVIMPCHVEHRDAQIDSYNSRCKAYASAESAARAR